MPTQNSVNLSSNIYSVANGGIGSTSNTTSGFVYGSGTSNVATTSVLTSGQTLIGSTGNPAVPATLTAGTNALVTSTSGSITVGSIVGTYVWISNTPASGSLGTISITSGITSTFRNYIFILNNLTFDTNSTALTMLISTNNGSTYISTGYQSALITTAYNSGTYATAGSITTALQLSLASGLGTTSFYNGTVWAYNLGSGTNAMFNTTVSYLDGSSVLQYGQGGSTTATSGVNAVQFSISSGNILTGNIAMYGINQ